MKKMFLAIFVLAILIFTGCTAEETSVDIILKGDNAADLVILMDEPNYASSVIAEAFASKLSEYTGKKVEIGELSEFDENSSVYSIYIDTVKEDGSNLPSFDVHMSITETDATTWIDKAVSTYDENYEIIFGETSAQIIAPDEYWLYFALEDFLEEFKNETYTVQSGTRVLVGGSLAIPTPAQLIAKAGDVQFLFTEHKVTFVYNSYDALAKNTALLVDGDGRDGMQGGGTDGTYAYYALYESDIANIYKFDLETWELVAVSEAIPTGHSNDITYVPEKHILMVADCTEADGWAGVHYIDPDTLEYIEYGILPHGCRGIDYIPSLQQYVITGSYTHNIYDKDFNHIRSFNCGFPQDTTQGLYSDGSYIYDSRWGEKNADDHSGQNHLLIHDLEGNFISHGEIHGDPYNNESENENVFIHNNLFYIGYYNNPRTVNEYVMLPVNMFN